MTINEAIGQLVDSVLLAHSSGDVEELKDTDQDLYEAVKTAEAWLAGDRDAAFTITFNSEDNFTAFMNMAEGMWLNYRDDNEVAQMELWGKLIEHMDAARIASRTDVPVSYPLTLPLPLDFVNVAKEIIANCTDVLGDIDFSNEDDRQNYIKEGDIVIS